MKYLLDVNALVALGFGNHEFHARVAYWLRAQQFPDLATCSITELGFLRVLVQAPSLRIHDRASTDPVASPESGQCITVYIYHRRSR